jgi:hypothetical protein
MEFLIAFFILVGIMATIGALLGVFDQKFGSSNTISGSSSNLDQRLRWMFRILLGIQIVGAVSVAFLALFVAIAGGGLDIIAFDPPGFYESCIMLPFVFPLTLITFANYPRLRERKWVKWLLIFTIIVNVILAVQIAMVLVIVLLIFL